jgi:hypothetical protein
VLVPHLSVLVPLAGGPGGVVPVLLPDVPVATVLLYAALNPVTIAVSYWLGRRADQLAKILIAAFAGALAGAMFLWLGTLLRLPPLATPGRAAAGIFAAGMIFAMIPAAIGYLRRNAASASNR